MYLNSEKKREIFAEHGKSKEDTGTAEGQIALFTYRINHLSLHLKKNPKCMKNQIFTGPWMALCGAS